jgi:hypothetical protein
VTAGEVLATLEREGWERTGPLVVRRGPVSVRLVQGRLAVGVGAVEVDNDVALVLARSLALTVPGAS